MIYRIDKIVENSINPITNCVYDDSWLILTLSDNLEYPMVTGTNNGCAYNIKINKALYDNCKLAAGDFIDYCNANNLNGILAISQNEYEEIQDCYNGHSYNEAFLRDYETPVLVHSTTMENWISIKKDGMLKSWNKLKAEHAIDEKTPIGKHLGDPASFSDYIMFGSGVSGEIVVNSKQSGKIVMDIDAEYLTGARLYFDADMMAKDGLLVRDGAHIKVKDTLPLESYLIWVATWDKIGLPNQVSTPKIFCEESNRCFGDKFNEYQEK